MSNLKKRFSRALLLCVFAFLVTAGFCQSAQVYAAGPSNGTCCPSGYSYPDLTDPNAVNACGGAYLTTLDLNAPDPLCCKSVPGANNGPPIYEMLPTVSCQNPTANTDNPCPGLTGIYNSACYESTCPSGATDNKTVCGSPQNNPNFKTSICCSGTPAAPANTAGLRTQPMDTAQGKCVLTSVLPDVNTPTNLVSTYCALNNPTSDPVVPGLTCDDGAGGNSTLLKCYAATTNACGENIPLQVSSSNNSSFENTYCSNGSHPGDIETSKLQCGNLQGKCYISSTGVCGQTVVSVSAPGTGVKAGQYATYCLNGYTTDPSTGSSCQPDQGYCHVHIETASDPFNTTAFSLCNQVPAGTPQRADCEACAKKDTVVTGDNGQSVVVGTGSIWTSVGCISTDKGSLITTIIKIALGIAGTGALLMIVAGGFMLSVSQGDTKRVGDAKELITSAVIGLLFIIFSVTILKFIGVTIFQLPGFGS